ncbi:Pantoate--beta-alanine ligase [hydrothermal vent metagenome]|uniref:pantoate--beta-alanine ligase (AMP-forming) n=1 Tax=hydrothermal vent metagenome TaxID=652676 RepID=A0A3B0WZ63_9ZZZZ
MSAGLVKQLETLAELRAMVSEWKRAGLTVGFVPTMGNLHAGHLSLVKLAQQRCDRVVVSLFVNPLQFGPNEDFDRYPRTLTEDIEKLNALQLNAVYLPSVEEMYPCGLAQTVVFIPGDLTNVLEGASRPGHFDGVSTVVCKLFNMVQPDVAVFGQKDYQQSLVIQKMVRDLALPIEVVVAPISRDKDGLALSSRNQYLSVEQRKVAPKLYVALQDIALAIASGNQHFNVLTEVAKERLIEEGFDSVDYLQVCDAVTLQAVDEASQAVVVLAVVRLGTTRLLDNQVVVI